MAKIKLTKNELKRQRDGLKMYKRYLPTLQLKKQQLQMEIRRMERQRLERYDERNTLLEGILQWAALFGEEIEVESHIRVKGLRRDVGNIAGIDIPLFEGLDFEEVSYDLFQTPLWLDAAAEGVTKVVTLDIELMLLDEQIRLLGEELRITTQRVNLFEKVKIPETNENIRRIQIYLGDEQTAAVVRGKIAKKKIVGVA